MLQKKRALLGVIILMAAIALSGCGGSSIPRLTEYINNKYDDTFTYVETSFVSLDGSVISAEYASEKYPDNEVYVEWYKYNDGTEEFTDNYMAIILNDGVKAELTEVVQEVLGTDVVVRCEPTIRFLSKEYGPESTIEDYLGDEGNDIYLEVFIPYGSGNPDEVQTYMEALCQAEKKAKIYTATEVFYLKDNHSIEDVIDMEWEEIVNVCELYADCYVDSEWNISLESINGVEQ